MANTDHKPLSTGITWGGVVAVVLLGLWPALHGAYWAIPLTAGVTATGIGVWRAVQILGLILNHLHWRDVEVPANDDLA
ncbi:hypothetical protein ACGFI4_20955 [Micromonospora carbonacea]|uniref:hypothetical protein n=1 Tax=Micromonospora carbonacea TaxID=47853 RepID=UPI00370F879A